MKFRCVLDEPGRGTALLTRISAPPFTCKMLLTPLTQRAGPQARDRACAPVVSSSSLPSSRPEWRQGDGPGLHGRVHIGNNTCPTAFGKAPHALPPGPPRLARDAGY